MTHLRPNNGTERPLRWLVSASLVAVGIGAPASLGIATAFAETPAADRGAAGGAATSLTLEQAVALALEQAPSLIPLRAEMGVARARLTGASLISQTNPDVQAAAGPRRIEGQRTLELDVAISQRLEIFGQRRARIDTANAVVASSDARFAARRIDLVAEVREAFGRALAAERALALAEEARELAADSFRAAEQRKAAGAASRLEVNTARGEVGRANREWAVATRQRTVAVGTLRLVVGIEPDQELRVVGALPATGRTRAGDLAALVEQALSRRPELAAARRELEAAQAEQRLAAREAIPVPRLGAAYRREEGAQFVVGTIGIDLPLFQRNQAGRGETAARTTEAERLLAALVRAVRIEVQVALERQRAAAIAAEAFAGGTLAAVEENARLVTEAYRAGKVDLFQLVLIRRESLDVRRGYIDTLEELNAAEAQLDRAIGIGP